MSLCRHCCLIPGDGILYYCGLEEGHEGTHRDAFGDARDNWTLPYEGWQEKSPRAALRRARDRRTPSVSDWRFHVYKGSL
jgi:hypothetical protein